MPKLPPSRISDADPLSSSFRIERWPFYWISRTGGRYHLAIEKTLKGCGLDVASWRALSVLSDQSPSSVSQIAHHAQTKLSTMTRIIQRMQEDGLVTCSPRPTDGRVTEVFITEAGERAANSARENVSPVFQRAFRGVSAKEIEMLVSLLRKIFDNLRDGEG